MVISPQRLVAERSSFFRRDDSGISSLRLEWTPNLFNTSILQITRAIRGFEISFFLPESKVFAESTEGSPERTDVLSRGDHDKHACFLPPSGGYFLFSLN